MIDPSGAEMHNVAMITGATGGLGKAFAAECAARGWDLALTDVSAEALAALAGGLRRLHGVRVAYRPCDLTDPEARDGFWAWAGRHRMAVHLLVNVAGLDHEGLFRERAPDEIQNIIRLNVESTVDTTRRVLAHRLPAGTLRIVTVSSLGAFYPMPYKAVYAASKRFLLDWSLALREELRADGVSVTVLCPGGLPTNAECRRAIEAQGFFGRLTTRNTGEVARATIDAALAGRAVVIPGAANRFLGAVGGALPPGWIAAGIRARWGRVHEKKRAFSPQAG
jgi:short-subunit dehydrogenase